MTTTPLDGKAPGHVVRSARARTGSRLDATLGRAVACAAAGLLLSATCRAQQAPTAVPGAVPIFAIDLDKVQWQPNATGSKIQFATLAGDRLKPGTYIQLVKWPPNTINKAHSHPDDRYAVVLKGVFHHGFGDRFDEKALETRPAGTFFTEPKRVRHYGVTKEEGAILYFVGTGPSTNDDPEK